MMAKTRGTTSRCSGSMPSDLHRVDLVADLAGAEVGADRRAGRAGDDQRGDDRARLADDGDDATRRR